ncbi:dTDP-4-dehydrorhamnose 3,5-epimerase family protein [Mucilaginibacter sp. KACC 22773]|uniref:dTDP-4-dehydrorhamnose 3,5-epimerase family protein n=1 Tax=Mucilaginibacter sp. KACC 22773 TaxID=3025671 RepID=UPI00236661AE|nr:dTDP-4-dehydrorhamnose 3,5-epimerase family protein [Mucilaginibacter sp. KACC 22773]WDF79145.1 dTDP-4-dehydrorhamnose 3,5-epimerase family protein [Mucilaginibacter sp. KACC 22773]
MELERTFIGGLFIVNLNLFKDNRGAFTKIFNEDFFVENALTTDFKENYFSVSHKNVIRGMHFQTPPAEHTKVVYVNQGRILDVVLDIRTGSPTFGKFYQTEISSEAPKLVYIPVGCAHGFLSLEDNTIVSYLQTSVYNQTCDKGIKWDTFGMDWGVTSPIISQRDNLFPDAGSYKDIF